MKKFFAFVAAALTAMTMNAESLTCAAAAEAALSVSANNEYYNDSAVYDVTGYVTEIAYAWSATSKNMSFWMADTKDGGKVLEAYKCAVENEADAPKVGDKVKVTGALTKYNTTPEFGPGCTVEIIERSAAAQNLGYKTIAEFLALKNTKDTCILRGAVANIVMDKTDSTQYNEYGNFDLVDATGSLYIYGLLTPEGEAKKFREMGIDAGDSITIKAIYTEYNGNPQAKNAILVEGGKGEEKPELPEGVISCDSAVVLAKALADPTADNKTVEGQQVKVWGYVTYSYNATEKDGVVKQSAWLADSKSAKNGNVQGAYLQIASMDAAVEKGDLVEIEGTLAKYYKAADNIIVEVINGTMKKVGEQGIENVVLTEKAQKVMVDGVIYIIRDNKMYNVQGTQVR